MTGTVLITDGRLSSFHTICGVLLAISYPLPMDKIPKEKHCCHCTEIHYIHWKILIFISIVSVDLDVFYIVVRSHADLIISVFRYYPSATENYLD